MHACRHITANACAYTKKTSSIMIGGAQDNFHFS